MKERYSYNINSAYLSRYVLNIRAGVAGKPQGRGAFFNDEQVATVRTEKIHHDTSTHQHVQVDVMSLLTSAILSNC